MTLNGQMPVGPSQNSTITPKAPVTNTSTDSAQVETPVPRARLALALLVSINLFNYIDRQVLAAVEPSIRTEFFPEVIDPQTGLAKEPADAKFWMGVLPFAFLITYMVTAPIFGWLANRMRRWVLIGIGVIVWSLASGGSGLAVVYLVMLLTRCFVGFGEGAYGPVAPDMISDLYPKHRRGRILAWFYAAIPFGGALGYALGDGVLKATGSWRVAFYLVVPPGLLLGLWCFLMRDPRRGQTEEAVSVERGRERWSDYLVLLKTPSYVLNTLGMTAMTFAMGGLAFWAPEYFKQRGAAPLLGIHPTTAFGGMTALTGLAATLLGGWAGDRLRPRFPGSYFLVSGSALVLAFPMLLLMILLPFPYAWIPLVCFVFFLFFNTGPTNTILANVTHPLLRAPGFALNILVIHLFGDAVSPAVMGAIAGVSNLSWAFGFVSIMVLIGGILWLWGTKYLERDTALAPTRLDAPTPDSTLV
ncbi:MAG TPA: MFS transporter [Gemmataceae bacterium]|nr:MFS transporter [Gemmataceae bacterium]